RVLTREASSRTHTCLRRPGKDIPNGSASPDTDTGPDDKRSRMLRRVGSAKAANACEILSGRLATWFSISNSGAARQPRLRLRPRLEDDVADVLSLARSLDMDALE